MNLLKIFLINIILIVNFYLFPDTIIKYFRSNSNGLQLVLINYQKTAEYKYFVKSYYTDNIENRRMLFKENKEYKRWAYYYSKGYLNFEEIYTNNIIKEDYRYDTSGHIIKKNEYKDGKVLRNYSYHYNNAGLVDIESMVNALNNAKTITNYRYDDNFTIKQIEKKYPDDRIVYWEAFFSSKGIIQKEFYTLKEERYIFLYNENGQETSGEIRNILKTK